MLETTVRTRTWLVGNLQVSSFGGASADLAHCLKKVGFEVENVSSLFMMKHCHGEGYHVQHIEKNQSKDGFMLSPEKANRKVLAEYWVYENKCDIPLMSDRVLASNEVMDILREHSLVPKRTWPH